MILLASLIRGLHFLSLMTVFGAAALLFQGRALALPDMQRPLFWASLTALLTAVLNLCFVTGAIVGDPAYGFDPFSVTSVVAQTFYGHVFLVRVALLIGLVVLCVVKGAHLVKALTAGAALALLGLTSHAAAAGAQVYETLRAAIDAAHLIAAGFWVGGLAVIAPEVVPRLRDMPRLIALLRLFSRWGVASVAVLLAAGTANAVAILAMRGMPWSTAYVTWLAIKIVLAFVMVALALTNRFSILPALARGEKEAQETIPLTVVAELACAIAILLIVGFLGLVAPMQM